MAHVPDESFLHAMLEAIPDLVWLKDAEGVYLGCNKAFTIQVGAVEADIIGKTDYDLTSAELADAFRAHDLQALAADMPLSNEEWIVFADDGRRALCATIKSCVRDAQGQVIGVLGVTRDITDLHAGQESLNREKRYLHAMIDNIPAHVWMKDTESRFLAVNRALADAHGGAGTESFVGKTDADMWPPDLAAAYLEVDLAVMATREQRTVEEQVAEQGGLTWYETYKGPLLDADGELLGTVGFSRDITRRKDIEIALRESEENFRAFFETVDDILVVATPDGQLVHTNPATSQRLGYSAEELATMQVLDLHAHAVRAEAADIFGAMARGERDTCPLPLESKTGEIIPVETRVWGGRWNGQDCIFGISKDLSREQEALQKFDSLFRSNPAPMAVSSAVDGRFSEVNDAWLRAVGFTREQVIGSTSSQLGIVADPVRMGLIRDHIAKHGHVSNMELAIRRSDGTIVEGLFSGEIIHSQGQDYLLTVMIDITDRKRTEEALAYAAQAAQAATQAKDNFLSTMSHELRTPLNSIIGFSGLLLSEGAGPINEEQKRQLSMVVTSSKHLLGLVEELLDLAVIESGGVTPHIEEFIVELVAADVVALIRPLAEARALDMVFSCSPDVGSVRSDARALRQVLVNLLGNAVKYTDHGRVALEVTVDGGGIVFAVSDTGRGISDKDLPHIMDSFYQGDSSVAAKSPGTGLGLAISKRMTAGLGGTLEVVSVLGSGSTFTLRLPRNHLL